MKRNIIFYVVVLFIGCSNPVDDLEIGEPFDQAAAVVDEWDLTRVRHVDNLEPSKAYTDLTAMFTASAATLEFTESSYTYSQGSGPVLLATSGSWALDDPDYPSAVVLNSNTSLTLGAAARPGTDSLILILERKCEDKVVSSYEYFFTRK